MIYIFSLFRLLGLNTQNDLFFFFLLRCVLKELGSNYWRVISLFDAAFLIDSRAFHANHDQG